MNTKSRISRLDWARTRAKRDIEDIVSRLSTASNPLMEFVVGKMHRDNPDVSVWVSDPVSGFQCSIRVPLYLSPMKIVEVLSGLHATAMRARAKSQEQAKWPFSAA